MASVRLRKFPAKTKTVPTYNAESPAIFRTRFALSKVYFGAAGRSRTDMGLLPHDFESCVSANFTTAARK